MALENIDAAPDAATDAAPAAIDAVVTTPDVDLSPVPESIRAHVDTAKYVADPDYKRAIEHGWKPKEVFLAEGGDEADWTGHRQFNRRYDDRQERKQIKKTMDEMRQNTEILIKTFSEEKQAAVQKALAAREAELKTAITDGDAARAVELQREISQMSQNPVLQQRAPQTEPLQVIAFREKTPYLNPEAAEFDPALNEEFNGIATQMATQYRQMYNRALYPDEINIIIEQAHKMIKPKVQPRRPVQTPPPVSKPATQKASTPRLTDLQKQMHSKLMSTDPSAAERYLKSVQSR